MPAVSPAWLLQKRGDVAIRADDAVCRSAGRVRPGALPWSHGVQHAPCDPRAPARRSTIMSMPMERQAVAVMLSKILKPFIKLSVDDFRRLAEQQFGSHPESRRAWPHFEPAAHAVVDNFWGTVDNPRFEAVVTMLEANPRSC